MSGGHWSYLQFNLRDDGEKLKDIFDTLATIEKVLDWGISADTSYEEAKADAITLIEGLFDRLQR